MGNVTTTLEEIRATLKTQREKVGDEAIGMIRALRRKLDETEAVLKRVIGDAGVLDRAAFTHQDAGVEEALTLAYRLSQLNGYNAAKNVAAALEEASTQEAKEPKRAGAPVMKETAPGEEKSDDSVEIPDTEPDVEPKKGKKK